MRRFHDGPAAIRQALGYLQDQDECRAGLAASPAS